MKYSQRFETAIHRLVKAFFEGTLKKGTCTACAVGTMCNGYSDWDKLFVSRGYGIQVRTGLNILRREPQKHLQEIEEELVLQSGYTADDLARIEEAFERSTYISWMEYRSFYHSKEAIMQDQFNGLMAVVDVLCEIEGIAPEPVKEYFNFDQSLKPIKELIEL